MKYAAFFLTAVTAAALAAPRSSTHYSVTAEIVDAGGALSTSATYAHHGSFHSMNGAAASGTGTYALLHGYLGQLSDSSLPAAFLAWQAVQCADPAAADAAPLADPDADGISNVAEYAWDLDPNEPGLTEFNPGTNATGLPVITVDVAGDMTVILPQRTDGSVAYVLERATDLTDWQPAPVTHSPPVAIDATWERATVFLPAATSGSRAQYRVVATLR